jgi:hypothetical protein
MQLVQQSAHDDYFRLNDNWKEAEVMLKIITRLKTFADEYDIDPPFTFTDKMVSHFNDMLISTFAEHELSLSLDDITSLLTADSRTAAIAQGCQIRECLSVTFHSRLWLLSSFGFDAVHPNCLCCSLRPPSPSPFIMMLKPFFETPVALHALGTALLEAMQTMSLTVIVQ